MVKANKDKVGGGTICLPAVTFGRLAVPSLAFGRGVLTSLGVSSGLGPSSYLSCSCFSLPLSA